MTALVTWLSGAFAPGWPERFAHTVAVALLAAAAVVAAFVLAEQTSLRSRARAVRRSWLRAVEATTTAEACGDGAWIARTSTYDTALYLLHTVITEEEP
ncbi:hypothetical protein Ppa06_64610 [Planomonospora parontospora subsp. parontospora]|uniref:Uncharacterized protein n=2 Tax=Planomonospora parontospora TaxID=58119 RepID=A0AA37BMN5_9ACTN|nr:hypothetical protein [Planomonospora parontospora]GGK94257.1 hypothetical protein GCM10010126_62070 [Planomonospora parontospora]GII12663.1 hypothetical protein Ppa06_64610 [Planomonospora parontospora subsp. parontospora]